MIERTVSKSLTDDFKKEKIILLMGARQVGKTTLAHELAMGRQRVLHLNCSKSAQPGVSALGPQFLKIPTYSRSPTPW